MGRLGGDSQVVEEDGESAAVGDLEKWVECEAGRSEVADAV
jgi:hypothetical protein